MTALSDADGALLVSLARAAVEARVRGFDPPDVRHAPVALCGPGDVFVTVEAPRDQLRGCLGSVGGEESLATVTVRLAGDAATCDDRFVPLEFADLVVFAVKVSVLGPRHRLVASSPADLCRRLRPGSDGVVLELPAPGSRALFLPEVWAKLDDDPGAFLGALSEKQGAAASAWRDQFELIRVSTFQTRAFRD